MIERKIRVLVAKPGLPVASAGDFVSYLKANPGRASYGSPGNGSIGHLWGEEAMVRSEMAALLELHRSGEITPHMDSTFSFAQAAEAHRRIQERKNVGKVVLVP